MLSRVRGETENSQALRGLPARRCSSPPRHRSARARRSSTLDNFTSCSRRYVIELRPLRFRPVCSAGFPEAAAATCRRRCARSTGICRAARVKRQQQEIASDLRCRRRRPRLLLRRPPIAPPDWAISTQHSIGGIAASTAANEVQGTAEEKWSDCFWAWMPRACLGIAD